MLLFFHSFFLVGIAVLNSLLYFGIDFTFRPIIALHQYFPYQIMLSGENQSNPAKNKGLSSLQIKWNLCKWFCYHCTSLGTYWIKQPRHRFSSRNIYWFLYCCYWKLTQHWRSFYNECRSDHPTIAEKKEFMSIIKGFLTIKRRNDLCALGEYIVT